MSTKVIRVKDEWTSTHFGDLPVGAWFSFCDEQDPDLFRICCKISEDSAIVFDNDFPGDPTIGKVSTDKSIYLEDVEIRVL